MITEPQQEIFSAIKLGLEALGYGVYDGVLPPEDTPYPFIYLGENPETDRDCKNATYGNVSQTIHIWHDNIKQRGTVSSMIFAAKMLCKSIEHTAHYSWSTQGMTSRIIPDNTTKSPLLHGVLEVDFNYS